MTGTQDDFEIDAVSWSYSTVTIPDETIFMVASKSNNTANTYLSDGSTSDLRSIYGDGTNNPILNPFGLRLKLKNIEFRFIFSLAPTILT